MSRNRNLNFLTYSMARQLLTVFICIGTQATWAQPQKQLPPVPGQTAQQKNFGPKRQAAVIIFAGLGGAILGLSTLSFYGRPQDKLANIAIGAAVGIIIGTVYVTFKAATQPTEFYGESYKTTMINHHQISRGPPEILIGPKFTF